MIGPSSGPAASARVLAPWSRLVSTLVTGILIPALMLISIKVVIPVLLLVLVMLLAVVSPLLRGGPALVGSLFLLLGVKAVVGGEGVVEVVVVALVGAGVGLLLPGVELQRAVPHSVTAVDQQT